MLALGCGRLGFDPPNSATDGGADGSTGGVDAGGGDGGSENDLYVDPGGDDGNPGTADQPLQTLSEAADRVVPGSKVYIAAGTYGAFTLTKSGNDFSSLIEFFGLDGAVVIQQGVADAAAVQFQASFAQIHNVTLECLTVCFSANPGPSATPIEQVKTGDVTFVGGTTQLLVTDTVGMFVFGSTFSGGQQAIQLSGASHYPAIVDSRINAENAAVVIFGQPGARVLSPKLERNAVGSIVEMVEVDSPEVHSNLLVANNSLRIVASGAGVVANNTFVATDSALSIDSVEPPVIVFNNVLFAGAAGTALSVDATTSVTSDRNAFAGTVAVNGGEIGFPNWQLGGQDPSSFQATEPELFDNLGRGMLMPPDGSVVGDAGLAAYEGVNAPEFDLNNGDRPVNEFDIGAWEQ